MAKAVKTVRTAKPVTDPGKPVFSILKYYFIFMSLVIGIDKFFYELTNWSAYVSPCILKMINCQDRPFVGITGLIEIIIGIGVAFKPRLFSYIICIWLLLNIINLLMTGCHFHILILDIGLLLSAYSLALLSKKYARHK